MAAGEVYATTASVNLPSGGLYRSIDSRNTWSVVFTGVDVVNVTEVTQELGCTSCLGTVFAAARPDRGRSLFPSIGLPSNPVIMNWIMARQLGGRCGGCMRDGKGARDRVTDGFKVRWRAWRTAETVT